MKTSLSKYLSWTVIIFIVISIICSSLPFPSSFSYLPNKNAVDQTLFNRYYPFLLQGPFLQLQFGKNSSSDGSNSSSNSHNSASKEFNIIINKGSGLPGVQHIFFDPPSIHIHAGDTVKWTNKDTVGHTVTAMAVKSPIIYPEKSNEGPSTFSHKFTQPGVYAYFCQIHPYMGGIVYVDTEETQRTLISSLNNRTVLDAKIEIPQNAAYEPNFGPMFIPSDAHIPFGSKITWTNKDYVPHTATSPEGLFDTKVIDPGDSKSIILNERYGIITYYCKIHPWMQGMITVDPPSPNQIK